MEKMGVAEFFDARTLALADAVASRVRRSSIADATTFAPRSRAVRACPRSLAVEQLDRDGKSGLGSSGEGLGASQGGMVDAKQMRRSGWPRS
jgi:hypothetical protein